MTGRAVNLTRLDPAIKRQVWAAVKIEAPDLAALLASDLVREAVADLGAEVTVSINQLPRAAREVL